jgi:hypothetical protein
MEPTGLEYELSQRQPGRCVQQPAQSAVSAAQLQPPWTHCSVAVLIPCFNEEVTIYKVVRDFRHALPDARVYVYDNCSTDATARVARTAGAIVQREELPGKGNVVRRMFRDIDADYYILVDGDDTYEAKAAPAMLERAVNGPFDLVNGVRVSPNTEESYRRGHQFGNTVLTRMVQLLFGDNVVDMLSGYKVLSRRFVKSFPAMSSGFEIETELTVHALELVMPVSHVKTLYQGRPEGSSSKLNSLRDGQRILIEILNLSKQERPLFFFSWIALFLAIVSLILAIPVVSGFLSTGLVLKLPTAVLATGVMLLAFLSFFCGLILDTVTRGRRETKMLQYLSIPLAPAVRQQSEFAALTVGSSYALSVAETMPRQRARNSRTGKKRPQPKVFADDVPK